MKLQRLGGYAALAALFLVIANELFASFLQRRTAFMDSPVKDMAAMSAMPTEFYVLNLLPILYSIIGFMMVLALHERMQANAPYLTRIMLIAASAATVMKIAASIILFQGIGVLVPMQDLSAFKAFISVVLGLRNASNYAFGCYFVFMGCAILRTHAFSRVIGWLFLLEGILLIAEFIAPMLGLISALAGIIAAVWIGITLLREKQPQPASKGIVVSI